LPDDPRALQLRRGDEECRREVDDDRVDLPVGQRQLGIVVGVEDRGRRGRPDLLLDGVEAGGADLRTEPGVRQRGDAGAPASGLSAIATTAWRRRSRARRSRRPACARR